MLLLNGERITTTHFRPSPMAVGMHLARLPRFGGGLVKGCEHWSVLHHTFLVHEIAVFLAAKPFDESEYTVKEIQIAALMHDATEIAIGDIPSPFKIAAVKTLEASLLSQLIMAWGAPHLNTEKRKLVKEADLLALLSEASRVAPSGLLDLILKEHGMRVMPKTVDMFDSYRENLLEYGRTPGTYTRDDLVEVYRNKVYHLLHADQSALPKAWGLHPDPYGKVNP